VTSKNNYKLLHPSEDFKGVCIIQADKSVEFKMLRKVMFSAATAGYQNVNFAVRLRPRRAAGPAALSEFAFPHVDRVFRSAVGSIGGWLSQGGRRLRHGRPSQGGAEMRKASFVVVGALTAGLFCPPGVERPNDRGPGHANSRICATRRSARSARQDECGASPAALPEMIASTRKPKKPTT